MTNIQERWNRFISYLEGKGTTVSFEEIDDTFVIKGNVSPLDSAILLKEGAYFGITRHPEDAMNKRWNIFTAFDIEPPVLPNKYGQRC
tara:strand:- start:82 stop:345 length:264 start_codon:yes stop_codon:yes gene_type:complete